MSEAINDRMTAGPELSPELLARYGRPFAEALAVFVRRLGETEGAGGAVRGAELAAVEPVLAWAEADAATEPAADAGASAEAYTPELASAALSGAFRRAMKRAGLNQRQVAERMGVTPAVVSRVLKRPQHSQLATLLRLADAVGWPFGALLVGSTFAAATTPDAADRDRSSR